MSLKQMQILDGAVAVKPEQEPVAWLLTDKNINSLQVDSIQRLIDRLKHAHHTDIRVRINGHDEWFEADWLKHMVRVTPPQPEQEPEYAWPTVADYERDVGFQTNEAFRIAWNMARTTNRMLGHTSSQPAQQEPVRVPVADNTYNYAKSLAEAIFKQHYASDEHYASGRIVWGVNDTVIGILTQIDNMVADMVRRPAPQQEPVPSIIQMLGHCPECGAKAHHFTSSPAQRTWVGLTDEEIETLWQNTSPYYDHQDFARAIEAAHGIKENT